MVERDEYKALLSAAVDGDLEYDDAWTWMDTVDARFTGLYEATPVPFREIPNPDTAEQMQHRASFVEWAETWIPAAPWPIAYDGSVPRREDQPFLRPLLEPDKLKRTVEAADGKADVLPGERQVREFGQHLDARADNVIPANVVCVAIAVRCYVYAPLAPAHTRLAAGIRLLEFFTQLRAQSVATLADVALGRMENAPEAPHYGRATFALSGARDMLAPFRQQFGAVVEAS